MFIILNFDSEMSDYCDTIITIILQVDFRISNHLFRDWDRCICSYSGKPPSDNGERGEFLKMDVEESISTTAATSRGKNFWAASSCKATTMTKRRCDKELELHIRSS
ncbi:uncharacterized protein LOC132303825 isoform X1 [Cornus florida]|uniref:uncharacterized protein LOC132303825 isoform X1 n=1 Tax=Cornus florida TaxID=4283 RepID=UPI0028A2850E|nr:uncharacterized protein LOC132303825 isoform X1 [Cornus florida]